MASVTVTTSPTTLDAAVSTRLVNVDNTGPRYVTLSSGLKVGPGQAEQVLVTAGTPLTGTTTTGTTTVKVDPTPVSTPAPEPAGAPTDYEPVGSVAAQAALDAAKYAPKASSVSAVSTVSTSASGTLVVGTLNRLDTTGGAATWTLPAASAAAAGGVVEVRVAAGTNPVTIARAGSDTVNITNTSRVLTAPEVAVTLRSDGVSNWSVVSTDTPATQLSATYGPLPTGTPTVGQVPVVATVSPLALGWGAGGGGAPSGSAGGDLGGSYPNPTLSTSIIPALAVNKARQARRAFDVADFGAVDDLVDRYACMASTVATAGNVVLTDVGLPTPVQSTAFTASTGGVLAGGQTLYYVITSRNQFGETAVGNEQSIVIPAGTNTNRTTLTWGLVTGATSYGIYRGTTPGGPYGLVTYQVAATGNYADNTVVTTTTAPPGANTTPAGMFTSADVGKLVGIPLSGASFSKWDGTTSYYSTTGTITQFIDGNNVKVSQATTTAVTRGNAQYGTDSVAAFNAAYAAAVPSGPNPRAQPATIFIKGRYAVSGPFNSSNVWSSYVSVLGNGVGKSKVAYMVAAPTQAFIQGAAAGSAPYQDCTFADFEVDGSSIGGASGYNVAYKGFYIQCAQRLIMRGLYCHDFPATGIGCDYLIDSMLSECISHNNGRMNTGALGGSSGIGVGTGLYVTENTIVSACQASGNGQYGIFVEKNGATFSRGPRIVGCFAALNQYGFGDAGTLGCVIEACTAMSNTKDGINVGPGTVSAAPGYAGLVTGNVCVSNGRYGIAYDATNATATAATQGRASIKNNTCRLNTSDGIRIIGGTQALPYMKVKNNDCEENTGIGINVVGGAGTITNLQVIGNSVLGNTGGAIATSGTFVTATIRDNPGHTPIGVARTVAGAITIVAATDTFTAPAVHGLAVGDPFVPGTVTSTTGITAGTTYYVNGVPSATTFTLSATPGGANLTLTTNGSLANGVVPGNLTVGASPFTYTAGFGPEAVYIDGGTVSAIVKNGVTIRTSTGAQVALAPNEAVVVTYSVAPVMVRDRL